MNYNNKSFKPISNTDNGETSSETIFKYIQTDDILTSEYSGGRIKKGHLIGIVDKDGCINMSYHQVNTDGKIMTGICKSTPEILENGKIIYSGQPLAFNAKNDFKIAELSTSASYEEVTKSLTLAGIITDDRGYCLLLKIPEQYTLNEVLQQLLHAGIHVDYFRDITHSVKQIFYDVH